MNSSNTIGKLAKALAEAQAEINPRVKFDSQNPFIKNKYASLGAVIDVIHEVLPSHGLSVPQFPISQEGRIGIRSILMHESGEWIEDVITVVPEIQKPLSINQAAGVSITYLRRYALVSILGLYADEDTDGDSSPAIGENQDANEKVKAVMKRNWTSSQTEAVSIRALDKGLEPLSEEDAKGLLDFSVLPENAPVKTIQSWFEHYVNSAGKTPLLKAADANEAYTKAKSGGKK